MTVTTEDHPIIGRTLYEAFERGELTELAERLRRDGRFEELVEQEDALRQLYEQNPGSRTVGVLVGEVQQARIRRTQREAAERDKPRAAAERQRAAEQYALDRELGGLTHGEFEDMVARYYSNTCPNDEAERPPHQIRGYLRRAGHRWTCALCGFQGDGRSIWQEVRNTN